AIPDHGLPSSVIINNLDIFRTSVRPAEADAPLVVDPDAVLAFPVTLQLFQPVARGRRQITQFSRRLQQGQFALRNLADRSPAACLASFIQVPGIGAAKALDHGSMI